MKLVTFLTLISAVQGCAKEKRHGLVPPKRVCVAFSAGLSTLTACSGGANLGVQSALSSCKTVDGHHVSSIGCYLAIVAAGSATLLGVTGIGAATLYGAGFIFAVAEVATGARDIALQGRDLDDSLSLSPSLMNRSWDDPTDFYGLTPSLNTSLPMLTFDDVARNLSYPFQFSRAGLINTYFPEGFYDDETMIYTYHLRNDASNHTDSRPEALEYDSQLGLQARTPEPENCDIHTTRHKTPYKSFPHVEVSKGHGIKFEMLDTCGHHRKAESKEEQDERLELYMEALKLMFNHDNAVLEFRVNQRAGEFTFSNSRLVIETRQFDLCYEGQHQDATCCV